MTDSDKIRLQMKLQKMLLKELEHEIDDSLLLDIMKEVEGVVRNFEYS